MESNKLNKSESKYYNTACLMNEALILLLEKKEYSFITIKEICEKAGVNRSTFYLHYNNNKVLDKQTIENSNLEDLFLVTPEYLLPYLEFLRENKAIYIINRFGFTQCSLIT